LNPHIRFELGKLNHRGTARLTAATKVISSTNISGKMKLKENHQPEGSHGAFPGASQGRCYRSPVGLDRVLFRGTLRSISYVNGMEIFLSSKKVLLKISLITLNAYERALQMRTVCGQAGRPFIYMSPPGHRKKNWSRR